MKKAALIFTSIILAQVVISFLIYGVAHSKQVFRTETTRTTSTNYRRPY